MIGSDLSLPSDLTVSAFFTAEFVRIGRDATYQGTDSMVNETHKNENALVQNIIIRIIEIYCTFK